ncbi:MAG: hypothetical protein E6J20_06020 [Chloroflexi bacterium]|nr:MAG: hypothetical protein E6J20_06020 [Chloroflexota bacterium]
MKGLILLIAAALALGSETWPQEAPSAPLAGFSFSPLISEYAERDPARDLKVLLDSTNPDLVRLPIYWESVAPEPDRLDFTSVDTLLAVVAAHNAVSRFTTRVVLTVGARNFLYPELHEPLWAGLRQQPDLGLAQAGPAYRAYFDTSITRYRGSPLLYAWQVENEPLDYVGNALTGADQITTSQLAWEIDEVHRLDRGHEAMITTYDGVNVPIDMLQLWAPQVLAPFGPDGHPSAALQAGDALGLDLYVDGPNIALRKLTSIDLREQWKQQAIAFWADRARSQGKDLWLAEMQAQPWGDSSTFSPTDLIESAVDYRQEPLQVVLMWGVDTWLDSPEWLAAGTQAMDILRAGP